MQQKEGLFKPISVQNNINNTLNKKKYRVLILASRVLGNKEIAKNNNNNRGTTPLLVANKQINYITLFELLI